jgi:predicted RecA/RadA family phage recombinase
MKTFIAPGDSLELTAPGGGVVSGTGVLIGALFVVPTVTAAAAAKFVGQARGVVEHAKVSAQAWSEGQRLYWNAGLSQVTSVATDGPFIGVAAAAAVNPSATGQVLLAGIGAELAEGLQAALTSLTDNSGGTPSDTIADVPAAYNEATLANQIASLAAKINGLITRLRDVGIIAP